MMINDITALAGANKKRKRVGRGEGSGHGKQSGRGNKGAGSRSGTSAKKAFEGGQMPYFRRLPKFGFTNAQFKVQFWAVNLADIVGHPNFAKGGDVNADALIKAGLVRDKSRDLKILGHMGKSKNLAVKLNVDASRVSDSARKIIEGAGGKVNESGTRRDRVRGVDRNSSDRTPKNLTKKLKRSAGSKAAGSKAAASKE
ncbi:MAG: 50S ribosomal protein L15 [Phycisphaerales bacterium]|jgi:large subunit ribosomal protein L15